MPIELSRRDFGKVVGLAAGVALFGDGVRELDKSFALDWLDHPENYTFASMAPLPPKHLRGVHGNSPFLYLKSDDVIDEHIEHLGPWINGMRIFVNDRFEKELDDFDESYVLERIINMSRKLHRMGKTISIDLLDGYSMKNSWNVMYGSGYATSPYIRDGIRQFLTGSTYIDAYARRIMTLAPTLNSLPNLAGVTLINESPYEDSPRGLLDLGNWYRMFAPFVHEAIPNASILPGVADPRILPDNISGLTATTAHVCTPQLVMGDLRHFITTSTLPLIIQENGIPEELFGIRIPPDRDTVLAGNLRETIYQSTITDPITNTVWLGSAALYPWKIVDGQYDTFTYNPETDVQSNHILSTYSDVTKSL